MSIKTAAQSEPVVVSQVGAVTAVGVVAAIVALLRSFGAPITDEQHVAITGVVAILAPLVASVLARAKVTPVEPQHRA
jgi:hypothetical protein